MFQMLDSRVRLTSKNENSFDSLTLCMPGYVSLEYKLANFLFKIGLPQKDFSKITVDITTFYLTKNLRYAASKRSSCDFQYSYGSRADYIQFIARHLNQYIHMDILVFPEKADNIHFLFDYAQGQDPNKVASIELKIRA